SGASYLANKKASRDRAVTRAKHARDVVDELYASLGREAADATRRGASELPPGNGRLLLDAALLVPRSRRSRFRAAAGRQARELAADGYQLSISGPWPAYSFMQD